MRGAADDFGVVSGQGERGLCFWPGRFWPWASVPAGGCSLPLLLVTARAFENALLEAPIPRLLS